MKLKQKALQAASGLFVKFIRVVGGSKASQIQAMLVEDLSPTLSQKTNFGEIKFFCPGKLPEGRARSLLTKEPETIEWIDNFQEHDVLWDVGANVGVYSLYAAVKGHSVLAFEPGPGNYYLLCKNIELNKYDDRIFAYCLALSDKTKLDVFFMANTDLGAALNSFGESVDWRGEPLDVKFNQAMIGFALDDFIKQFNPAFPNHIKIDVDGIEEKIIEGAKQTLSDERLKSILVELDSSRKELCDNVIQMLDQSGLVLYKKTHALELDGTDYASGYNYIFIRPK